MADFYADENFDYPVVERLRLLGHDVLTVQEANQAGGDDVRVLATATAAKRAVLTFDRRDFERLHRQSSTHGGIVSCTWDADNHALAGRIHSAVASAGPLARQHLRINKPP